MRSLIPSDFLALKVEPQTNMWYQLFPFSGPTVAIAMQHHPGNIHQFATPNHIILYICLMILLSNFENYSMIAYFDF
jgi:hypothetical protein